MEFCAKPETCPKCGSIFVDWDRYQKAYRCLVKSCGWIRRYQTTEKCQVIVDEKYSVE